MATSSAFGGAEVWEQTPRMMTEAAWVQEQGTAGRAPLRGRTQPIDLTGDRKEWLTGTDTDEHWGFEVTMTGDYKFQDIHGGETSGEST